MPGVPRQHRRTRRKNEYGRDARRRAACLSRSAQSSVPELRGVLCEDPRVQRGQDAAAMRLLAIFGIATALAAQDKTSPAPAADELSMTGSVDVGYRWISGVGGNFDVYRSVVNLAEGPKLLGASLTFQ